MPAALAAILPSLLRYGPEAVVNLVALFQQYKANNIDPASITEAKVTADLQQLGVDVTAYDAA